MPNIERLKKYNKIHMVGIGGVSMSGIAEILINFGFTVTGSNNVETETTKKLEKAGIETTKYKAFKSVNIEDLYYISDFNYVTTNYMPYALGICIRNSIDKTISKICNHCGYKKPKLSLSERIYKCECCGQEIDRDYNASINLKNEALNIRMRRAEFRSVEDVEDIQSLVMQALDIGASDESESTTCESVHKAYSL